MVDAIHIAKKDQDEKWANFIYEANVTFNMAKN